MARKRKQQRQAEDTRLDRVIYFGMDAAVCLGSGLVIGLIFGMLAGPYHKVAWSIGFALGFGDRLVRILRKKDTVITESDGDAESDDDTEAPPDSMGGVIRQTVMHSVLGGILGIMLGGFLMLTWFSISLSPLSPDSWRQSLTMPSKPEDDTFRDEWADAVDIGGISSEHWSLTMVFVGGLLLPILALGGHTFVTGLYRVLFSNSGVRKSLDP